jgi:hypothetical protein
MRCPPIREWTKTEQHTASKVRPEREDKEAFTIMANEDCSCWKTVQCETSKDCLEKCGSGKTCWEASFLHNNWKKVFEKCKHCKVFQQNVTKYK